MWRRLEIEAEFWKHIEHHQRLQQQHVVGKDALK
jgi:hypothetical protein